MCLTLNYNFNSEMPQVIKPYKADKDIKVYKLLIKRQKWTWLTGFNKEVLLTPHLNMEVELGMHYYQTGKKFTVFVDRQELRAQISIGLHAYTTLKQARRQKRNTFGNLIIVECIIPKGSEYYRNEHHIVSDNLIYTHNIVK